MRRKIAIIGWYFFARYLPGHGAKTILGRIRSWIGRFCLKESDPSSVVGQMVDFGSGNNISIGKNSGIGNGCVVKGGSSIHIGENVTMGPNVMILSSSHDFYVREGEWMDEPVSRPITIKGECFIGAGAIILAGVTIEKRTIIAAGSVVTRSVEPGVVVGGVPAKVIGKVKGYDCDSF